MLEIQGLFMLYYLVFECGQISLEEMLRLKYIKGGAVDVKEM